MPSTENSDGSRSVVAVFDFDGTITRRDTFRDIFHWRFGLLRLSIGMLLTSPLITMYALGRVGNDLPKIALFKHFFRGWSIADYRNMCACYATQRLPELIRPQARERIKWHRDQGHLLIICSASLADWIEPWARAIGFDHVIATRAQVLDGCLSGGFEYPCIYGAEKVAALARLGVNASDWVIYAYGDSKGDRELLSIAHYPVFRAFHGCGT